MDCAAVILVALRLGKQDIHRQGTIEACLTVTNTKPLLTLNPYEPFAWSTEACPRSTSG